MGRAIDWERLRKTENAWEARRRDNETTRQRDNETTRLQKIMRA